MNPSSYWALGAFTGLLAMTLMSILGFPLGYILGVIIILGSAFIGRHIEISLDSIETDKEVQK